MMKLNIATTRAVRAHVSTAGVDWPAVRNLLTNPDRQLADGRTVRHFVGSRWNDIEVAIRNQLAYWQDTEAVLGPRGTLRLLSVMGSTDYTTHWWGHGWWPAHCAQLRRELETKQVELPAQYCGDEFAVMNLECDLRTRPDELPDDVLTFCLDPPGCRGLRYGAVQRPPARVLTVAD